MKKLLITLTFLLPVMFLFAQPTAPTTIDRAMSVWSRTIANSNATQAYTDATTNYDATVTNGASITEIADSLVTELLKADSAQVNDMTVDTLAATDATIGDLVISDSGTVTGVLIPLAGISQTPTVLEITTIVTVDSTKIVGDDAGDVGHVDGAVLVAAPSSDYVLEFVSAIFIYDYGTATFGGGGDDVIVQIGAASSQVTVSGAITGANLLEAGGDKILQLGAIATELVPLVGGAISINGTALTNPGTATGSLRVHLTYRKHTTGL